MSQPPIALWLGIQINLLSKNQYTSHLGLVLRSDRSFDWRFTICRTEIPEESPTANSAKRAKR